MFTKAFAKQTSPAYEQATKACVNENFLQLSRGAFVFINNFLPPFLVVPILQHDELIRL